MFIKNRIFDLVYLSKYGSLEFIQIFEVRTSVSLAKKESRSRHASECA